MGLGRFWWWVVLILVQFGMNGCFGCWEHERAALLQLKASINSTADIDYFRTWNSSTNKKSDCCDWGGVKCNSTTGHIIQLDLNYRIGWSREDWCLNASLFLPFEELQSLDLEGNWISKWVPNEGFERFSALHKLERLNLANNHFNNNILSSFSGISLLKKLDLGSNNLNGSVHNKGLCELRNLREISLSNNHFEGILPSYMANWTSLNFLDLSDNHFSGNVHSLSDFRSLEFLSLSNNEFLNPITFSSFFNLSNLMFLFSDKNKIAFETDSHTRVPTFQLRLFRLSECSFNGLNTTLPTFLHYQYDLREIDLSHNNLSGKFPTWLLENNTRLEIIILRNNSFTGFFLVPDHLHPNITEIDISSNCLQGPIPTNLGLIFPNLEYLNMADNAFQGSIPSSFGNWVSLWHLDLSKNNLSGAMPVHFTLGCYSLEFLKLSYNNFSGQIFPTSFNLTNLRYLFLDNNHFSGKIPNSISLMIYGEEIDLSNNNLSGMLPMWMGNMSYLMAIVMANNQLEGPIPIELCKLVCLKFLELSENNLSGLVPPCFNSSTIQFFHLNKNSLSGPISSVFSNNSNLVTLNLRDNYLSGNIPNWIGSVSSLSILLLGENHLEGRIPIQLCLLQNLNLLDLSFNKISGPIPHCLSNLTFNASAEEHNFGSLLFREFAKIKRPALAYLYPKRPAWADRLEVPETDTWAHTDLIEEVEFTTKSRTYSYKGDILNYMFGIDLSCNMLVGEIPPQLGRISSNIRAINLSHNYLTGSIPITFSNLKQMESLDLSYNNLNGKIPPQLTELTSLEVFSVAHNNLSGPLPDRKYQFGTFDENSYEGNPLLCGPPLHKDCTKIGPQPIMPVDHMEEKSGSFMDIGVFYISFVVAYIIVLLGIVTVLYINPYWRKAWFNLIEECIDTCYCFVAVYYHKLFNFRLA